MKKAAKYDFDNETGSKTKTKDDNEFGLLTEGIGFSESNLTNSEQTPLTPKKLQTDTGPAESRPEIKNRRKQMVRSKDVPRRRPGSSRLEGVLNESFETKQLATVRNSPAISGRVSERRPQDDLSVDQILADLQPAEIATSQPEEVPTESLMEFLSDIGNIDAPGLSSSTRTGDGNKVLNARSSAVSPSKRAELTSRAEILVFEALGRAGGSKIAKKASALKHAPEEVRDDYDAFILKRATNEYNSFLTELHAARIAAGSQSESGAPPSAIAPHEKMTPMNPRLEDQSIDPVSNPEEKPLT